MTNIDVSRQHKLAGKEPSIFAFPYPVIEGQKYLILFDFKDFAEFFVRAINASRLVIDQKQVQTLRIHQDAQTPILALPPHAWHLKLFENLSEKSEAAKKIEETLNAKLKEFFYSPAETKFEKRDALSKTWMAQQNCKSCQALGFNSPVNEALFAILNLKK